MTHFIRIWSICQSDIFSLFSLFLGTKVNHMYHIDNEITHNCTKFTLGMDNKIHLIGDYGQSYIYMLKVKWNYILLYSNLLIKLIWL